MVSPWQNPLLLYEYTTSRVVVYFYSGRWIPIMFFSLVEAIALHRRALLSGQELFIFPADVDPCDCQNFVDWTVLHQAPQTKPDFTQGGTQSKTAARVALKS